MIFVLSNIFLSPLDASHQELTPHVRSLFLPSLCDSLHISGVGPVVSLLFVCEVANRPQRIAYTYLPFSQSSYRKMDVRASIQRILKSILCKNVLVVLLAFLK